MDPLKVTILCIGDTDILAERYRLGSSVSCSSSASSAGGAALSLDERSPASRACVR